MLAAFGGLLMLLGLLSGAVLSGSALGLLPQQPGWSAWLAYPALTLLGYAFFVVPARDKPIQWVTQAAGALCTLLGMAAVAALVLRSLGLLGFESGTLALCWVFGCSLLLGPLGWLGGKLPKA